MGFNFYTLYYGYYIGISVSASIGKKYVYYLQHNVQKKRRWVLPADPKVPAQLNMRFLLKQAVLAWHDLTPSQKISYQDFRSKTKVYSGYNSFISSYIKSYI